MNKNLNLVKILKDCPKGTKLYAILFGGVEFEYIKYNKIFTTDKRGFTRVFTQNGAWDCTHADVDECLLFPSKDQRDWSKFKILSELIDGEFYYCVYNYNQTENHVIFIYKKHIMYKTNYYAALDIGHSILSKNSFIVNNNKIITELRKATEKEKRRLLNTIEIRNYEWDSDKKELVKIEQKFNISTLQPFDKVLVRDYSDNNWCCGFFSHIGNYLYKFICIGSAYNQCIPYNDETKLLVGTTEMPPKKYITWEE